jgi:hypothetical protein
MLVSKSKLFITSLRASASLHLCVEYFIGKNFVALKFNAETQRRGGAEKPTAYSRVQNILFFLLFTLLAGCSPSEEGDNKKYRNQKGEYVYRKQAESLFIPPAEPVPPWHYSWDKDEKGCTLPKITKEHFRCKGCSTHPYRTVQKEEVEKIYDCGGVQKHSLPLREGKEFVYPILLELLNYIQMQTGKKVVVCCGHRCPQHQRYADPSPENRYSKHLIGAEVAFYVQGWETQPEKIVALLQQFYQETPRYAGQKEFLVFKRYEKGDCHVAVQPWFNKEIFIKLFAKEEGRNFDIRHSCPYISIQVRYDRELDEKVTYNEKQANNYLRKEK